MLISDSRRFVFVHVPKTGGDSVDKLLRDQVEDVRKQDGTRHAPLSRILGTEPALAAYWSFGIVRNPWARMVSWWSMIDKWNHAWGPASGKPQVRRGGMKDGNRMWRTVAAYDGFEEFVLRGTAEIPRLAMPQVDYLTAGDRRADLVGRTESLAADVARIQASLGLPDVPVPHHNRSGGGHYTDYYSPAARDRVAAVYAADLDEFGYRYGE